MCLVKHTQLNTPQTARSLRSGRSGGDPWQGHLTFLNNEVAVIIPTSQGCFETQVCEYPMEKCVVDSKATHEN